MKDQTKPAWWQEIDPQFDFEKLPEWNRTKQLLKKEDHLEMPEDGEFFEQLHDKIMSGVENRSIQKNRGLVWHKHRRLVKRTVAVFFALVIVILSRQTEIQKRQDSANLVLSDALKRTNVEESILVSQHKNEFFVDLAAESLDHLSADQLKELMQTELLN